MEDDSDVLYEHVLMLQHRIRTLEQIMIYLTRTGRMVLPFISHDVREMFEMQVEVAEAFLRGDIESEVNRSSPILYNDFSRYAEFHQAVENNPELRRKLGILREGPSMVRRDNSLDEEEGA